MESYVRVDNVPPLLLAKIERSKLTLALKQRAGNFQSLSSGAELTVFGVFFNPGEIPTTAVQSQLITRYEQLYK